MADPIPRAARLLNDEAHKAHDTHEAHDAHHAHDARRLDPATSAR
ncbi:hypothetical protein [Sorangium sp. So ce426]